MDLYVTSFYLRTPFLIPLHFFVADDEFQGVNHPPSPPSPYHGGSGVPEEVHLTLGGMQPRLTRGSVEFTYSIDSCVVYRLELLESYGHYLTTAPASTGGPSNHVTGKYRYLVALPTQLSRR